MAAENNGLSIALAGASKYSSRIITFAAPIDFRKSTEEDLPVNAVTSLPNLDISITPIEPTPPVAPDTKMGSSDSCEESKIFKTLAAAVKPAVPIDIASILVSADGFFTTHSAGTLMYSPKPPGVFIPMS